MVDPLDELQNVPLAMVLLDFCQTIVCAPSFRVVLEVQLAWNEAPRIVAWLYGFGANSHRSAHSVVVELAA